MTNKTIPPGLGQLIAISAFTVLVLASSFLIGKHIGYEQGKNDSQPIEQVVEQAVE